MVGGAKRARASHRALQNTGVTAKRFYDWQTLGGTDDVMRLVELHPRLWESLPNDLRQEIDCPLGNGQAEQPAIHGHSCVHG